MNSNFLNETGTCVDDADEIIGIISIFDMDKMWLTGDLNFLKNSESHTMLTKAIEWWNWKNQMFFLRST